MEEKYRLAEEYLRARLPDAPDVGIILGSGLGGLAQEIENPVEIPYGEVPGMASSTAPGHAGRFVAGTLAGVRVLCMQGRLHPYEGPTMCDVVFPVRVMRLLGVRALVVTNAAGGINKDFAPGDLMLISDHINFMGDNPLIGANDAEFGVRFPDMSYAYAPELRRIAREAAAELAMPLREGVYIACKGPNYETPAEIRAFRALGADAVGMSTVPEVLAAAHCGMWVLAFSLITNMAAGVCAERLDEQEVIAAGERKGRELRALVRAVLARFETL